MVGEELKIDAWQLNWGVGTVAGIQSARSSPAEGCAKEASQN